MCTCVQVYVLVLEWRLAEATRFTLLPGDSFSLHLELDRQPAVSFLSLPSAVPAAEVQRPREAACVGAGIGLRVFTFMQHAFLPTEPSL